MKGTNKKKEDLYSATSESESDKKFILTDGE